MASPLVQIRERNGYQGLVTSGVARGGQGGHGPPQTFGKCFFFCNEFRKISRSGGNVKKSFPNEGDLSVLPLIVIPKNFCYYPPPPLNLAGLWRSRKISGTTPPPHRIWSACGDHGKVAPPKKKSWLRRCL